LLAFDGPIPIADTDQYLPFVALSKFQSLNPAGRPLYGTRKYGATDGGNPLEEVAPSVTQTAQGRCSKAFRVPQIQKTARLASEPGNSMIAKMDEKNKGSLPLFGFNRRRPPELDQACVG
jgi:hypothetical protein